MALVFGAQIISALPHTAVAAELEKQAANDQGNARGSRARHKAVLPTQITEPSPNTKADINELESRETLLVEELERTR
jgi:hypothetical protein